MKFSCLYPLHYESKLHDVRVSFESIINQSLKTNEIFIIFDGPIKKEVILFLQKFKKKNKIKIIKFKKNLGLGRVLKKAIKLTKYEIIIRADSDDINKKSRFKNLINFFKKNPDVHVVSSLIKEKSFKEYFVKKLPLNHNEILRIKNFKNPINHPAVAFKKKAVLKSGGYEDVPYFEDYFLWLKMINKNFKFKNINKVLVESKINQNFYTRRSGFKYFKNYLFFLNKIYSKNYINIFEYVINFVIRLFVYILPLEFIVFFYKNLNNRKKYD